ncbi:MAG TPA: branched-chain amino acid transaminase [Aggregatilineales bacterium]|nr:branched-chain amino acid transaminase [Anaerolineales bacterium]HRE49181.1 branched-chain amino acid transaminase [Aggregatilineales bacterium]
MALAHGPYVWFDGKFVRWEDATVHVGVHALHYGSSVFEGIRAYDTKQGTAIFRLAPHVQRMVNSCKIVRIAVPYTADELSQAIQEVVALNGQPACYIRPLIFRGMGSFDLDGRPNPTQVVILSFAWGPYLGAGAIENGIEAMVSSWRRLSPSDGAPMGKIGGQYVNNSFARMEAKDNGYGEALELDLNGNMSEGSGENLFVVLDGVIYTPPIGTSILAGVTRSSVIQLARDLGYEVRETVMSRDVLYIADEMFVTGTAAEITPIRSLDKVPIGSGTRGAITKALQEEFFGIVSGNMVDRHGWLTPVTLGEPAKG